MLLLRAVTLTIGSMSGACSFVRCVVEWNSGTYNIILVVGAALVLVDGGKGKQIILV